MRRQNIQEAERHIRSYGELVLLAGNTSGPMHSRRADLKLIRIEAGKSTSYHRHLIAESLFYVLEGRLLCRADDSQPLRIESGDTFVIEPGESHQLINDTDVPALVVEVESPPHDRHDKFVIGAGPREPRSARPVGRFWRDTSDVRVKICGLRELDAAYHCLELGVDAIGIHAVGAEGMDRLRAWSRWLHAVPSELSVFLLTDVYEPTELQEMAWWCGADTVQLQGRAEPEQVRRCAEKLRFGGWRVVKSMGMRDLAEAEALAYGRAVAPSIDAFLLDATFAGGQGVAHDWTVTRRFKEAVDPPVILAGGLNPENVGVAVGTAAPYAIDVESGVELRLPSTEGGTVSVRSFSRIAALLRAVRGAT